MTHDGNCCEDQFFQFRYYKVVKTSFCLGFSICFLCKHLPLNVFRGLHLPKAEIRPNNLANIFGKTAYHFEQNKRNYSHCIYNERVSQTYPHSSDPKGFCQLGSIMILCAVVWNLAFWRMLFSTIPPPLVALTASPTLAAYLLAGQSGIRPLVCGDATIDMQWGESTSFLWQTSSMCLYSNRSWATTLYKHKESARVMYNGAILPLLYVVV